MDVTFLMTSALNPKAFGARLKAARLKHELSQEQLGKEVDVSKSTICLCENGKVKDVSGSILILMARRLNVTPSWLLFGESW